MASYAALETDGEVEVGQRSSAASAGPAKRLILSKIGTRAELFEDEEGAGERWHFDEDAYTLGLMALFQHRIRQAFGALCLAMLAPILQTFIMLQVYRYFSSLPKQTEGSLSTQLVCSGLTVLQLANEAVEGLQKVIFSLRWLLGFYDWPLCSVSAIAGSILGLMQMFLGLATCNLCIQVIFTSETILDTFFNYVALAFIADVDNYIIGSRLIRSYYTFEPELRVRWASPDSLTTARGHWIPMLITAINSTVCWMMPMNIIAVDLATKAMEPPVELDWLAMVPRTLVLWIGMNGILVLLGRRYPICWVAFNLTVVCFLVQVAGFAASYFLALRQPDEKGCRVFNPLEKAVLMAFSCLLLPAACAVELRPFSAVKLVPLQVKLVMVLTLMFTYELWRDGCA